MCKNCHLNRFWNGFYAYKKQDIYKNICRDRTPSEEPVRNVLQSNGYNLSKMCYTQN